MKALLIFTCGALLVQDLQQSDPNGDFYFCEPTRPSTEEEAEVSLTVRRFRRRATAYPYVIYVEV